MLSTPTMIINRKHRITTPPLKENARRELWWFLTSRTRGGRIRDEIAPILFYYGKYTDSNGKTIRNSMWIDKINRDLNISLEGSKKTKEITIQNSGIYKEIITMQPNAVVLIEISKVESP